MRSIAIPHSHPTTSAPALLTARKSRHRSFIDARLLANLSETTSCTLHNADNTEPHHSSPPSTPRESESERARRGWWQALNKVNSSFPHWDYTTQPMISTNSILCSCRSTATTSGGKQPPAVRPSHHPHRDTYLSALCRD